MVTPGDQCDAGGWPARCVCIKRHELPRTNIGKVLVDGDTIHTTVGCFHGSLLQGIWAARAERDELRAENTSLWTVVVAARELKCTGRNGGVYNVGVSSFIALRDALAALDAVSSASEATDVKPEQHGHEPGASREAARIPAPVASDSRPASPLREPREDATPMTVSVARDLLARNKALQRAAYCARDFMRHHGLTDSFTFDELEAALGEKPEASSHPAEPRRCYCGKFELPVNYTHGVAKYDGDWVHCGSECFDNASPAPADPQPGDPRPLDMPKGLDALGAFEWQLENLAGKRWLDVPTLDGPRRRLVDLWAQCEQTLFRFRELRARFASDYVSRDQLEALAKEWDARAALYRREADSDADYSSASDVEECAGQLRRLLKGEGTP